MTLPNVVELKNISQSYDSGKSFVIKDVNLTIEDKPNQGQIVSILGPSGCGKSTLLRFICGLQKPYQGEVHLYGKPKTESDHVGMIFQKYSSFPWLTVLENVAMGLRLQGIPKKERNERAMLMLEKVGLKDQYWKYAQYPTLSGGQLQRVAIARSLLANSRIICLDEPFGALDLRTRVQMQDNLNQLWFDLGSKDELFTLILITHDITEAVYLSDEILIMGNAPAKFEEKIKIDLPLLRNRDLKKTDYFRNTVAYLEDRMMNLEKK